MEWIDQGIVLGVRRHGEGSAIAELMTRAHGRHLGLVRGGGGSRMRPVLQPGNTVQAVWRARLDEHLGNYSIEAIRLRTGVFFSVPYAVLAVTHLAALCRLLPERDPHLEVCEALEALLNEFDDSYRAAAHVVRFELDLLAELGFGLDLSTCAVTGVSAGLVYVSPRSGRAVCHEAGEPWRTRLLPLPAFLRDDAKCAEPSEGDLAAAFALTGFFLARHVLEPRGLTLSGAREAFISAVLNRRQPAIAAS
jgi:DNA repair protein RecO (recombination protein O)